MQSATDWMPALRPEAGSPHAKDTSQVVEKRRSPFLVSLANEGLKYHQDVALDSRELI
jgi:hypothetical protein